MQLELIRNATLKVTYGGHILLIDPYFAPRHSLPSFTGRSPNPMTELPRSIDDILQGVELVIVSHLHTDHFDAVAKERVPKTLPILCQPGDEGRIRDAGFTNVTPLAQSITWQGLTITPRQGSHGVGPVVEKMGPVIGLTLEAAGEPTVYWAGDTVLYPPVAETIREFSPDIIVTHSCGARWDGDLIVMDDKQTLEVSRLAPEATIVATHMEALDHATVTRQDLRQTAEAGGLGPSRLLIPVDGETLHLGR
ncbi:MULTISPECIES: MBL fold metallo-hydrolase [Rhizobium]|jgi:L-ascorbate metabolism protein UlaG (beta-lactamase superfamily)|uniref:L-ascorbate metabolism protein UlaG (Beta-lactamase superfamily) n=1 Tax=Rhizobium miluonense TaxID=411945 RepID=A0ABU1SRY1_9HYPH|nr:MULTISPECIES: MBL fold metallo-hydrolase [Rhizobium]MBB3423266.1 L-ascorbate metabolism protein UlaG (beta-lactamase superfamily) [Rhizobium sp. BK312]MDR6901741.1 L-ascorbate metabolism protein UlaG (beta-lactamase superfamily) [Rhizobium miluonense]